MMSRLQLYPQQNLTQNTNSIQQLLFSDLLLNLSDDESENDENTLNYPPKTKLAKEESNLEKQIIKIIHSNQTDNLKPNSGQAVTVGEHNVCVGFHEETGSEYRVWEWHGHIVLFDSPEYIYGNYFERIKSVSKDEEKEVGNVGLKELIGSVGNRSGRVVHRNLNAGSGLTSLSFEFGSNTLTFQVSDSSKPAEN